MWLGKKHTVFGSWGFFSFSFCFPCTLLVSAFFFCFLSFLSLDETLSRQSLEWGKESRIVTRSGGALGILEPVVGAKTSNTFLNWVSFYDSFWPSLNYDWQEATLKRRLQILELLLGSLLCQLTTGKPFYWCFACYNCGNSQQPGILCALDCTRVAFFSPIFARELMWKVLFPRINFLLAEIYSTLLFLTTSFACLVQGTCLKLILEQKVANYNCLVKVCKNECILCQFLIETNQVLIHAITCKQNKLN